MNKIGTPNVFTVDEETCFVNCVLSMSDFGSPIGESDLKSIVKDYLTKHGKKVKVFKNNCPGTDWIKQFIQRHKQLSVRFVSNIKKARAAIIENMIKEYMNILLSISSSSKCLWTCRWTKENWKA